MNEIAKITFKKQTLSNQLGKVQTVQGHGVVQHDAPEVKRVEDGSDAARRRFRHRHLLTKHCQLFASL